MKQIKNIAILVPSLERGGMERVAANLSELLQSFGYEVYIFVTYYDRKSVYHHAGKIVRCYCTIDQSNTINERISYLINASIIRMLKKKYAIDATISFAPEMNLINILSGGKDRKILTIHNCMSLRDDMQSLAYQRKYMLLHNLAYKVIAVCNWCRNDLNKNFHIFSSKLEVIYNQSEIGAKCELRAKRNVILVVGRLEKIKQQWHAIKAFRYISERVSDSELWIAGNGPDEEKLKNLACSLKIENKVRFLGYVKDIGKLYFEAKILMMTSKSEAFPCVAVEALSHGVPIVSAYIPGGLYECMGERICLQNSYPIEMSAGYITTPFDHKDDSSDIVISSEEIELGKAAVHILQNAQLYKEKVQGAYEAVKKFDSKIIARQWKDLLMEERKR